MISFSWTVATVRLRLAVIRENHAQSGRWLKGEKAANEKAANLVTFHLAQFLFSAIATLRGCNWKNHNETHLKSSPTFNCPNHMSLTFHQHRSRYFCSPQSNPIQLRHQFPLYATLSFDFVSATCQDNIENGHGRLTPRRWLCGFFSKGVRKTLNSLILYKVM